MTKEIKYKSLRVPVELHTAIKAKADSKYMSIISFLQYIADKKEI